MTDKEKFRKEVEKLKSNLIYGACSSQIAMETMCKEEAYNEVLAILDTMQKESVSEELEDAVDSYTRKVLERTNCLIGNQPVGEEISKAVKFGAKWQKAKDESTTEDLEDYINELSKQFPEVSFAKLSRIAVRVAKWQKEKLWKPADGDDLPEIDREVIAILDNGMVVFAHRPPEYWDGKDIVTGKVTRYYPKTYDKGGWNMPNVKYWLDCLMPKEIEL